MTSSPVDGALRILKRALGLVAGAALAVGALVLMLATLAAGLVVGVLLLLGSLLRGRRPQRASFVWRSASQRRPSAEASEVIDVPMVEVAEVVDVADDPPRR